MKSLRVIIGYQIYSNKCNFNHGGCLAQDNNEHVTNILYDFISDFGAPEHLTFDGSDIQVVRIMGLFKLLLKQ